MSDDNESDENDIDIDEISNNDDDRSSIESDDSDNDDTNNEPIASEWVFVQCGNDVSPQGLQNVQPTNHGWQIVTELNSAGQYIDEFLPWCKDLSAHR